MGGDLTIKPSGRINKRSSNSSSSSSSSPSSSSASDSESPERRRGSSRRREKRDRSGHRRSRRESESSSRKRKISRRDREENKKRKHRRRSRREDGSRKGVTRSDSFSSSSDVDSEPESPNVKALVRGILKRFPDVAGDLKQLLQAIDDRQAVDVAGISNRTLVKHLKKLFRALSLKQNGDGLFMLPSRGIPTLEVVGSLLFSEVKPRELPPSGSPDGVQFSLSDQGCAQNNGEAEVGLTKPQVEYDVSSAPPKRRLIGPEMPSAELLAAAAELTEAENALKDADLEVENDLFIGPPPPAVVAEAESANEAERFEEVARITGAEVDKPYDVLGVNWKMSFDNIKKRYWKLSLMVHPDKCSHPQAHQAFVILNQAFKELQDPDKRKSTDEKIRLKEEQEEFMAELRSLREAAQWRRLQGISMEGDEELLADTKQPPKRDEWMTTLPPERKLGMTMQSTFFSKSNKEGRGDTSVWTDNPLDKAEKAKTNYLEAYNKATALAAQDDEKKRTGSDADLVDKYTRSKRSISLVQKHREESSHPKKKSKQPEKEEWVGQHPWKPWDREKDLTAGRMKVNLDSDGMAQGLSSRFSSGAVQRNFL